MTDYDLIRKRSAALKKRCGSAGPREIAEHLGIGLLEMPMGTSDNALKGFIQKNCRMITIGINTDLPEDVQEMVLFHEIGHHQQRHLNAFRSGALKDTSLFFHQGSAPLDRTENEANLFAADYILDTEKTLGALQTYDLAGAARALYVPVEFLDYKLRLLYHTGQFDAYHDVYGIQSDFMRRIRTGIPCSCSAE